MSQIQDEIGRELRQKIEEEGEIVDEQYLNVSSFLNHRIQRPIMEKIATALAEEYKEEDITLVLTAEAAGNVIAYETAGKLSEVKDRQINALYAKKGKPATMDEDCVSYAIESPTKGNQTTLYATEEFLQGEKVLIVDDFLFTGRTSQALTEMAEEAGAEVVGYGFTIMKRSYGGYKKLKENYDCPIVSVVEIKSLNPEEDEIVFA